MATTRGGNATTGAPPTWAAPAACPSSCAEPGTDASREFSQRRLTLWAKTVFFLMLAYFLVENALPLASLEEFRSPPAQLVHLGVVILLAGAWLTCRRDELSERELRGIDAGIVFVGCCGTVLYVLLDEPFQADTFLVPLIVFISLILRSIFVPSSARHTLWVSLATAGAAMGIAVALRPDEPLSPLLPASVVMAWSAVFSLSAAILATLTSRLVFGLRQEVRKAFQVGQYTLEDKLGEGGMGVVYRARHALLRRPTAIKLLPLEKAGADSLRRFEREVQLTALLSHPNTVAVFDYGQTPDGIFYYAMEHLDGIDLGTLVREDGAQPAARVIHILRQVCGSLTEAHGVGLIHRDIKPANIILCERGGIPDVAKVVDFGLVKELDHAQDLTATGVITGTPLYLAPEAVRSSAIDARSDIYAVGAVGYFLLAGRNVFEGDTLVEVCSHHLHTTPSPPSERLGRPLPRDLEAAVLSCLEKDPDLRPQSARALLGRLAACEDAGRWSEQEAAEWWTVRRDRPERAGHGPPSEVACGSPSCSTSDRPIEDVPAALEVPPR